MQADRIIAVRTNKTVYRDGNLALKVLSLIHISEPTRPY